MIFDTINSTIFETADTKYIIKVYNGHLGQSCMFNEVTIMEQLEDVPKVVFKDFNKRFVVMEQCGIDLIDAKDTVIINNIDLLITNISKTVNDIHNLGYYHGDIKLENILFDDKKFTLIDFGFTKRLDSKERRLSGTTPYISPACMNSKKSSLSLITNDRFAFCLVVLSFLSNNIVRYACRDCILKEHYGCLCKGEFYSIISLDDIKMLYGNIDKKYFPFLEFVLLNMDQTARFAVFKNKSYQYHHMSSLPQVPINDSIDKIWEQITNWNKLKMEGIQ